MNRRDFDPSNVNRCKRWYVDLLRSRLQFDMLPRCYEDKSIRPLKNLKALFWLCHVFWNLYMMDFFFLTLNMVGQLYLYCVNHSMKGIQRFAQVFRKGKKKKNKAGYTANTSRGRVGRGGNACFPTFRLERDGPTDQPTDGRSKPLIESLIRD